MSEVYTVRNLDIYYPAHYADDLVAVVKGSKFYNNEDFGFVSENNWFLFPEKNSIMKEMKSRMGRHMLYDIAKLELRIGLGKHVPEDVKEVLLHNVGQTLYDVIQRGAPIMQDEVIGPLFVPRLKLFKFQEAPLTW